MYYLLFVSLLWAFSFGLIKDNLSTLDSNLVAFLRLFISLLVFMPFLKIRTIEKIIVWKLILLGSIQFGIMYAAYIYAFKYLDAYEVVLFTIFTPIYVNILNDVIEKKFHFVFLLTGILSVVGTAIILNDELTATHIILGFLLIQISNLSFAFGQVYYKRIMLKLKKVRDKDIFGLLYVGAVGVTFIFALLTTHIREIEVSGVQILTLLYLGAIASGLGFFLWNMGVRKSNIGTVAIFNNLKIPLGILVSLLFFGESVKITNLLLGGLIVIIALVINEYYFNKSIQQKSLEREM